MQQVMNLGDRRQQEQCAFCAGPPETRDHVPPRVLLDVPYPDGLPVVPACASCNSGVSQDEEYLACLIECVVSGWSGNNSVLRPRIADVLSRRPALAARIAQARQEEAGRLVFGIEEPRVRAVIVKLARGHAAFELNEPQFDEPSRVAFLPLTSLPSESRAGFEAAPPSNTWPEVGSRAMQRLVEGVSGAWLIVQPGRYRFLASAGPNLLVRIVFSEYLAAEVCWD